MKVREFRNAKGGHLPKPSLTKTLKIMNVNVQISDAVYAKLLNGSTRIQGTLALANPNEGNFHAHNKTWRPKPGTHTMKMPHGRVSVTSDDVRVNLRIKRNEKIDMPQAILDESVDASNFVVVITEKL